MRRSNTGPVLGLETARWWMQCTSTNRTRVQEMEVKARVSNHGQEIWMLWVRAMEKVKEERKRAIHVEDKDILPGNAQE